MVWVRQVTRWWNRLFLVFTAAMILACGSFRMGPELINCTLIGCSGGLTIEITGVSLAVGYEVTLTLPSGEKITQVCDESPRNDFEKSCTDAGVFFALPVDIDPPETVEVEVVVNGESHTQEFSPTYEKFQPNGEDCPPVCYNAGLDFQITN